MKEKPLILPAGMQKNNIHWTTGKLQQGFTLLEIIVVMLMIGILSGIAVTSIRFDSADNQLKQQVEAFTSFYQGAQDEAILSHHVVRLEKQNDKLQAQRLVDNNWQDFSLGQGHQQLTLNNKEIQTTLTRPIVLYPNGQSSLFSITFSQQEQQQTLSADAFGRLTLTER